MKQKEILYFSVITTLVLSIVLYSVQLKGFEEKTKGHFSASEKSIELQNELPSLAMLIDENGCLDLQEFDENTFKTQAYRSETFKDDRNWLTAHFNKAFSQGEGACGSNSLDTALYGQKAMIMRFNEELSKIEKTKGKNSQYDYVRQKGAEMKAFALTKNMREGQWLTEFGYGTLDIQKRPLTIIDGLEAFFPNIINEVKSRGLNGYTPNQIYEDVENGAYTNGYEFVDSTINLSIPLNSSERAKPWRNQSYFREFVMRTFDPYDAEMYLSNKQDPRFNEASKNPRLSNGKTMYAMYKEWLINYKKFTPYKSNLEKLHNQQSNNSSQGAQGAQNSNGQGTSVPTGPTIITLPEKNIIEETYSNANSNSLNNNQNIILPIENIEQINKYFEEQKSNITNTQNEIIQEETKQKEQKVPIASPGRILRF